MCPSVLVASPSAALGLGLVLGFVLVVPIVLVVRVVRKFVGSVVVSVGFVVSVVAVAVGLSAVVVFVVRCWPFSRLFFSTDFCATLVVVGRSCWSMSLRLVARSL